MRLHFFSVTSEDIKNGRRGNLRECPMARALNRTLKEPGPLMFERSSVPRRIQDFQRRFDAQLEVKPGIYVIDLDLAESRSISATHRQIR